MSPSGFTAQHWWFHTVSRLTFFLDVHSAPGQLTELLQQLAFYVPERRDWVSSLIKLLQPLQEVSCTNVYMHEIQLCAGPVYIETGGMKLLLVISAKASSVRSKGTLIV